MTYIKLLHEACQLMSVSDYVILPMANPSNKNLQTEVDACFLYNKLAEAEPDATVANVFRPMALGEWISVKSSQELHENQMQLEMEELETNPEGEQKELALIYITKGIPEDQAYAMAAGIMMNKSDAYDVLVKEELGINVEEMKGSAMEAAIYSFVLFAIGAVIPVIPFMFTNGITAIIISIIGSAAGLFLIGSAITLFTGKSIWFSGFRQVIFGLIAAAITFGIGKLIGVSLAG